MHGSTFTFIAARAKDYPLVWRRGQLRSQIPRALEHRDRNLDATGRWLLLNTLETNRLLRGHAVQKA